MVKMFLSDQYSQDMGYWIYWVLFVVTLAKDRIESIGCHFNKTIFGIFYGRGYSMSMEPLN